MKLNSGGALADALSPSGFRFNNVTIEEISNGFLLRHNFPGPMPSTTYFSTLGEMFEFLKEKVFQEADQ